MSQYRVTYSIKRHFTLDTGNWFLDAFAFLRSWKWKKVSYVKDFESHVEIKLVGGGVYTLDNISLKRIL